MRPGYYRLGTPAVDTYLKIEWVVWQGSNHGHILLHLAGFIPSRVVLWRAKACTCPYWCCRLFYLIDGQ